MFITKPQLRWLQGLAEQTATGSPHQLLCAAQLMWPFLLLRLRCSAGLCGCDIRRGRHHASGHRPAHALHHRQWCGPAGLCRACHTFICRTCTPAPVHAPPSKATHTPVRDFSCASRAAAAAAVHRRPSCGTQSAGLDVTPTGLALAAVVALDEAGRLGPAGVTTPVAAFQGTSYWPRLVEW